MLIALPPHHNQTHWVLFRKHVSPPRAKQTQTSATAALSCHTPRRVLEQLVLDKLTPLDEDQDGVLLKAPKSYFYFQRLSLELHLGFTDLQPFPGS